MCLLGAGAQFGAGIASGDFKSSSGVLNAFSSLGPLNHHSSLVGNFPVPFEEPEFPAWSALPRSWCLSELWGCAHSVRSGSHPRGSCCSASPCLSLPIKLQNLPCNPIPAFYPEMDVIGGTGCGSCFCCVARATRMAPEDRKGQTFLSATVWSISD